MPPLDDTGQQTDPLKQPGQVVPPIDKSTALAQSLATKASEQLPGAIAAEEKQAAEQKAAARATVGELETTGKERSEAYELLKAKLPAPPGPPPTRQPSDPWQAWGSPAMAFAMLASAFTRRPAINAMNAAAGVMNAYHAGDEQAFKDQYQHWKDQTEYGHQLYEYQRDAYKDAMEKLDKDEKSSLAKLRVLASALNDDPLKRVLDTVGAGGAIQLMRQRDLANEKAQAELPLAKYNAELMGNFISAQKALQENPTDPDARQRYQAAAQAMKDFQAAMGKTAAGGFDMLLDPSRKDDAGNPTPYLFDKRTGTTTDLQHQPYTPGGAQKVGTGGGAAGDKLRMETDLFNKFVAAYKADPNNPPITPEKEAEFHSLASGAFSGRGGAASGVISDDAASLLADQAIAGDTGAITMLPRGGPSRIKVENLIAEKLKAEPEGARTIMMNRIRMVEARSEATTAGRVTMNTAIFSKEAVNAGQEVIDRSKDFPRYQMPTINQALRAYYQQTGDPRVIAFGFAINALYNAYGKMSNPTGTGIHDADKTRIEQLLDTSLSEAQIEKGVKQIIREGQIMSDAAVQAQKDVLEETIPRIGGGAATAAPTAAPRATGAPGPAPARPAGVPEGSAYSPSRQQWRDPDGKFYDAQGNPIPTPANQ